MRLTAEQVEAIKATFCSVFKKGSIMLFGSRTDDLKKGGDIDLFIDTEDTKSCFTEKLRFLVLLKRRIGEQKIDVLISSNTPNYLRDEICQKGILIWKI